MEEQARILSDIIMQYSSLLDDETAEMLANETEEIMYEFSGWCDDWSLEGLRTHLGSEIARHICDIEGIYTLDDDRVNVVLDIVDEFYQQVS